MAISDFKNARESLGPQSQVLGLTRQGLGTDRFGLDPWSITLRSYSTQYSQDKSLRIRLIRGWAWLAPKLESRRPRTRYKKELDPDAIPQFGLVAEEVEKVNPDLVARDDQGKPYTVRYDAVNAMLLNEFLKEHRTVQEQEATITRQRNDFETAIAQQQRQIEALTATVKEQAAKIQRVSAQLELSRPVPRTVLNNQ